VHQDEEKTSAVCSDKIYGEDWQSRDLIITVRFGDETPRRGGNGMV
jgi:hypothetical protein